MKTILVGVDFTPDFEQILKEAYRVAEREKAEVHLLHVTEPVDDPDSDDPETEKFYRELEERAQKKLDEQLQLSGSLRASSIMRVGPRDLTILQVADELAADLIVLGSHPIGPEAQRFSTSHRVALASRRPVLLIPFKPGS